MLLGCRKGSFVKSTVEANDHFSQSLQTFLNKMRLDSSDQEVAKMALMKNYEEMTDYTYRLSLSSARFVENETSALVLPNTGGSTGIMALYWVYLAASETGKITIKVGEDRNFELFLSILDSPLIETYDNRAEFEQSGASRHSDLLVVYGSDRTCQMLSIGRDVLQRTVLYASKTSIAVIHDAENLNYEAFARDLFTYDGLGCLSPSVVYINDAEAFVEKIKTYVPTKFDMNKISFNHQNEDKMRFPAVVRELGVEPKISVGRGTLVVVEETDHEKIDRDLEKYRGKVSCVVSDVEPGPMTQVLGATR